MTALTSRRGILKSIQLLVGLGLIVLLIDHIRWARFFEVLARLNLPVLVTLLFVTVAGLYFRFYMWQVLLWPSVTPSWAAAARTDLVANFVNQLLPSRVSGRTVAPLVLKRFSDLSWSQAVAVAVVHTGLYALLYGIVGFIGVLVTWPVLSPELWALVTFSTGLYLAVGAGLLLVAGRVEPVDGIGDTLGSLVSRLPGSDRIRARVPDGQTFTADVASDVRGLVASPGRVSRYGLGWIGAMLLAPGVRTWLLFDAFGVSFTPVVLLPVYVVLAYSVTVLPITPGGIGVTEATATLVFVALGIPADVVVPVVLTERFFGVYAPALLGGVPALEIDLADLR